MRKMHLGTMIDGFREALEKIAKYEGPLEDDAKYLRSVARAALDQKWESPSEVDCPGEYESFNNGWYLECKLCGKRPIEHRKREEEGNNG